MGYRLPSVIPAPGGVGLGTSPRHSIDSSAGGGVVGGVVTEAVEAVGDVVEKTAKVIKTAALHDARNILGKEDKEEGEAFTWNVSNAKEAKVSLPIVYILCFQY